MKVKILPSKLNGIYFAPTSKSIAHRMLILASIEKGETLIKRVSFSKDVLATIDCLKALGVKIEVFDDSVKVLGDGFSSVPNGAILNCNESGSTLRFLIPLALCFDKEITFIGTEKLFSRPLEEYQKICNDYGFTFEKGNSSLKVKGKLTATNLQVLGNISSQYITGLLFALVYCNKASVLKIIPPIESKPYIDLTLKAIEDFGGLVNFEGNVITINPSKLKTGEFEVEADYSSSAFIDAFNLIGGNVLVKNLNEKSLQADKKYVEYFNLLQKERAVLDISSCPDLGPVLIAVATYFHGATILGTKRLKIKESDRAEVMKQELEKFGAKILVFEDKIEVEKVNLEKPKKLLSSHNDHRIAMALSVICSIYGGEIDGAECVSKSFPTYWEDVEKLGLKIIKE